MKISLTLAVLLIFVVIINAYAGEIAPMDLTKAPEKDEHTVLLLHLDEGDGAVAKDSSGLGNNGKIEGAPVWCEGKFGNALQGNGGGDHINCLGERHQPPHFDFGQTTDFTVELWINTTSKTRGGWLINKKQRLYPDDPGFSIWFDTGIAKASIADGINQVDLAHRTPIADGNWHHIALVVTRKAKAVLYVDGVPGVASGFPQGQDRVDYLTDVTNDRKELRIMNRGQGDGPKVIVDEIRISNVVRPMAAAPNSSPTTVPAPDPAGSAAGPKSDPAPAAKRP